MRCREAKDLILTDYVDGELSEGRGREIKRHLNTCASCRAFEANAHKNISAPFGLINKEEAPQYLWEGIRERIYSKDKARFGVISDTVESIRWALAPLFRIPRPIVAFAAAAMIIVGLLAVIRPFAQSYAIDEYLREQSTFISGLSAEEANGENMFDTNIKSSAENFI